MRVRVIDFETTDKKAPPGEVVEYGLCDLIRAPSGQWVVGRPISCLYSVQALPPEVRALHHLTMA